MRERIIDFVKQELARIPDSLDDQEIGLELVVRLLNNKQLVPQDSDLPNNPDVSAVFRCTMEM